MSAEQDVSQNFKMPLVSFIIPYYNIPVEMLYNCINSILRISLSSDEREIILIDDGSDENLEHQLYSKYPHDIQYFRQKNGGTSVARNKGLDIANGKYIQFVDADDILCQEEYNQCVMELKRNEPDILLFNYQKSYSDGNIKKISHVEKYAKTKGSDYLLNHNLHGSPCFYLFKSELAQGLRFPENLMNEDEEFAPQLIMNAEKMILSPKYAYIYQYREDSQTNNMNRHHLLKRLEDLRTIISSDIRMKQIICQKPYRTCKTRGYIHCHIRTTQQNTIYSVSLRTQASDFSC